MKKKYCQKKDAYYASNFVNPTIFPHFSEVNNCYNYLHILVINSAKSIKLSLTKSLANVFNGVFSIV